MVASATWVQLLLSVHCHIIFIWWTFPARNIIVYRLGWCRDLSFTRTTKSLFEILPTPQIPTVIFTFVGYLKSNPEMAKRFSYIIYRFCVRVLTILSQNVQCSIFANCCPTLFHTRQSICVLTNQCTMFTKLWCMCVHCTWMKDHIYSYHVQARHNLHESCYYAAFCCSL